jgi:hypothetical protein
VNTKNWAEAQQKLAHKMGPAVRCLSTEDGKQLLKVLEDEFLFGSLIRSTTDEMLFALGAREVVVFLRSAQRFMTQRKGDDNG